MTPQPDLLQWTNTVSRVATAQQTLKTHKQVCTSFRALELRCILGGALLGTGCVKCGASKFSPGTRNKDCHSCTVTNGAFGPECSTCPPNTYDTMPGLLVQTHQRLSIPLGGNTRTRGCVACAGGKYSTGYGTQVS